MPASGIIDAEVHLLHPDAGRTTFASGRDEPARRAIHEHPDFPKVQPLLGLEALRASMVRSGIGRAVLMGLPWRDGGILRENNEYVGHCVRSDPRAFRALYIPDPIRPRAAAREVEGLDAAVYAGIKLVPSWQGVAVDDPSLVPLWRAVEERRFVAMIHTDHPTQSLEGDVPYRLLRCAARNPDLRLVAPHLGGLLCLYGLLPAVAERLSNVHFVSSVSATMEMVAFAAAVNPRNLVFGTDFPFNHCHSQEAPLEAFRKLGLPEPVGRAILGETAQALFGFAAGAGERT